MQLSVRMMLAFLAVVALVLTALIYANIWWASLFITAALGLVGLSLIGVIVVRGDRRSAWIGCFICCAGYLASLYAWNLDQRVGPLLITTKALAWLQPRIQQTDSFEAEVIVPAFRGTEQTLDNPWPFDVRRNSPLAGPSTMVPPQWEPFQQVGHGFLSILLGGAGAAAASWIQNSNRPVRE